MEESITQDEYKLENETTYIQTQILQEGKRTLLHKWLLFSWLLWKKVSKRLLGKTFFDIAIFSRA